MVTNQIYILITLVTAHIVGDFLFQTKNDVKNKSNNWVFAKHILTVTVLSYLFVGIWNNWIIPLIIAVSHTIIDQLKLKSNFNNFSNIFGFVIDQLAHLLIIGIIVLTIGTNDTAASYWIEELGIIFVKINIYASGFILTVFTGGIIIGMLVKPFLEQLEDDRKGLEKGGELIGRLERLLIFFFMLIGEITAVGFLVAAKSIFRFGELSDSNNRKHAEYILIGTLYSFSWAFVLSWLTQRVILIM